MQEGHFFRETEWVHSDLIIENCRGREEMQKNDTVIMASKPYCALQLIRVFIGVMGKASSH